MLPERISKIPVLTDQYSDKNFFLYILIARKIRVIRELRESNLE